MYKSLIIKLCFIVLPFFSYSNYAQTSKANVITAFSQGSAGNCASISVIKLAIATYGLHNVFLEEKHEGNSYHIVMRDKTAIDILDSEINQMDSDQNRFIRKDDKEIYEYAAFLYAVMAKYKQNKEGLSSITKANRYYKWGLIRTTNHLLAMDTEVNLEYLGFKGLYDKVKKEDVSKHDKIIVTSQKHSVFATNGDYDDHGEIVAITEFSKKYREINEMYNYILK